MEKESAKWVGGAVFLILGVVTKGYNQGGNPVWDTIQEDN